MKVGTILSFDPSVNMKEKFARYVSYGFDNFQLSISAENMTDAIGMDVQFITDTRVMQGKFGDTNNVIIKGIENRKKAYDTEKYEIYKAAGETLGKDENGEKTHGRTRKRRSRLYRRIQS